MATHRRYTRKEKAEAVATATMEGTRAAADHIGVPESTIRYWMDDPKFALLRDKTGDQVADAMWVVIQRGVERIAELIPRTEDLAKVGVAVGILYDKRALLTGAATGRTEHRDLTGTLSDNDVLGAIQAAADLTSGSGSRTEEEAPNPPEG